MSVEQIKSAIAELSLEERAELAAWFHGWVDDEWDAQMKADIALASSTSFCAKWMKMFTLGAARNAVIWAGARGYQMFRCDPAQLCSAHFPGALSQYADRRPFWRAKRLLPQNYYR
ncbi:MAG: hypothetical protein ACR2IV_10330 [Bryobacteraceae bacterium]